MSLAFSLADVAFLTSARGESLLAQLATADLSDSNLLRLIPRIRQTHTPDETSSAIETARLRRRATDKFGPDAAHMLLTEPALQQASHPAVRAWRVRGWPGSTLDVCCSIGSDTLAFARAGHEVIGLDNDPVRVAMAQHNATALGVTAAFDVRDVTQGTLPPADTLFYDPARRDDHGNRIHNVADYIPPLSLIDAWRPNYNRLAVKLSPGVDLTQVPYPTATLTFISVNGDLKEAQLTFGGAQIPGLHALLLTPDGDYIYTPHDAHLSDLPPPAAPRRWLCEPDPSIIRAGYVAHLAAALGGAQLDHQIAYFTTDTAPVSPWVRSWEILDWMPFQLKRLRAYLRQHHVGRVTVKKRGSPLTPEILTRKLKLKGDHARTLILTRLNDDPIVLICHEMPQKG